MPTLNIGVVTYCAFVTFSAALLKSGKTGLDQQFTDEEIRSIIETAHRLGRRVAAHAHGAAGINAALEAGMPSREAIKAATVNAAKLLDLSEKPERSRQANRPM